MKPELIIRKAGAEDQEEIWMVLEPVICEGGTYVFDSNSSKEKMISYWLGEDKWTYVAVMEGEIVGTFYLKANQVDLGDHICNAGFVINPKKKGKGIGRTMGMFALEEAKALGFSAMQFNFVISSNLSALTLWKSLDFQIIGEIPEAYRHPRLGLVSAFVLYRKL